MKKTLIVAAVTASFATAASAQSSVTLYGLIDAGLTFVNNEASLKTKGHGSTFSATSGNLNGSRWGLKGQEDLGGGVKAIFTLESGFNIMNGAAGQGDAFGNGVSSRTFGRQAFVGLTSNNYGTVTLGRQYDSVVDYLGPLTANGSWGGTYFAHIADNDNTDNTFRINNSVKYQSANYSGFSFGGLYGFSNDSTSFSANRAYSAGMSYANGPLTIAAAYLQTQGADSNDSGAVTESLLPSQTQRTYGVGANYSVGALTFGGVWTQSRMQFGPGDATVRFNNYELNARYNLTPALALGGAYTFTDAKNYMPGPNNNDHARYHQFGLQADYSLSKRTDFYAEGVVQLANNGRTAQIYGTGAPSTVSNQVVLTTGIRHRF
jgi:general bacterial porin, GBP family